MGEAEGGGKAGETEEEEAKSREFGARSGMVLIRAARTTVVECCSLLSASEPCSQLDKWNERKVTSGVETRVRSLDVLC